MTKSYEIEPRSLELGGGWDLRRLENGEEVGGSYFPPVPTPHAAYIDLLDVALDWVEAQVEHQKLSCD